MAVNINSQEFANAWRIVSEALLAGLQGSNFAAQPPVQQPGIQQPSVAPTVSPAVVSPPNLPLQAATKRSIMFGMPVVL